jgi:hypothetical protein
MLRDNILRNIRAQKLTLRISWGSKRKPRVDMMLFSLSVTAAVVIQAWARGRRARRRARSYVAVRGLQRELWVEAASPPPSPPAGHMPRRQALAGGCASALLRLYLMCAGLGGAMAVDPSRRQPENHTRPAAPAAVDGPSELWVVLFMMVLLYTFLRSECPCPKAFSHGDVDNEAVPARVASDDELPALVASDDEEPVGPRIGV